MTCVRQGKAREETGLTLLCDKYLKIISHDTERRSLNPSLTIC